MPTESISAKVTREEILTVIFQLLHFSVSLKGIELIPNEKDLLFKDSFLGGHTHKKLLQRQQGRRLAAQGGNRERASWGTLRSQRFEWVTKGFGDESGRVSV